MITFDSITLQDDGSWLYIWSPTGAPSYRIVLYGLEVGTTTDTQFTDSTGLSYPQPYEVVEEGQLAVSEINPPRINMEWYSVPGALYYEVDQWNGFSWQPLENVLEDGTQPVYAFLTQRLTDETLYKFRVMSADLLDQLSVAREFDVFVVTPPFFDDRAAAAGWNATTGQIEINSVP